MKKNKLINILLSIGAITILAAGSFGNAFAQGYTNPRPAFESFSKTPNFGSGLWPQLIFDGNNQIAVNNGTSFNNSSASIEDGHFKLQQVPNKNWSPQAPYYNGAAAIGFRGYQATKQQDVVWRFDMKVNDTYGTSGFVVELQNTFDSTGNFANPFTFFGATYEGPNNAEAGLSCVSVNNWNQVFVQPLSADASQWNHYLIRFHYISDTAVQAQMFVNGKKGCETTISNYGPTEVQLWSDNYLITSSGISYQNQGQTQNTLYDNIFAAAIPALP